MPEETKFKPGDHVTWTSQAGGRSKTKQGIILLVIPPNVSLSDLYKGAAIRELQPKYKVDHLGIFGSRPHESYLIQVGKSKRLYWPLVKYLKHVEANEHEIDFADESPERRAARLVRKRDQARRKEEALPYFPPLNAKEDS